MRDTNERRSVSPGGGRFFVTDERGLAAVEFALILPVMLFLYLGMVELSRGVRAARQVDLAAHTVADLIGQDQAASGASECAAGNTATANSTTAAVLCPSYLAGVITAAGTMLTPLNPTSLTITVSEINVQANGSNYYATVNWSYTFNGGSSRATSSGGAYAWCNTIASSSLTAANALTPLAPTAVTPIQVSGIPQAYVTSGSATAGPIIVADVSYTYTPIVAVGAGVFGGGAFGKLFTQGGFLMQRTAYGVVRNQYAGAAPYYNHIQYPSSISFPISVTLNTPSGAQTFNITAGYNCLSPTL